MSEKKLGLDFLQRAAQARDVLGERTRAHQRLQGLLDVAGDDAALADAVHALGDDELWPALEELGEGSFAWVKEALERELGRRSGPASPEQEAAGRADAPENPYLDAYAAFVVDDDDLEGTLARLDRLRRAYAYAVPTPAAIDLLAAQGPLVELGAGTGYWAWLLRKRGVDIVAYDLDPPNGTLKNHWFRGARCWTGVEKGGIDDLAKHRDRALLLCWPPSHSAVALDAVRAHGGDRVIFVGEWGTHLGTPALWDALGSDFEEVARVDLPAWWDDEIVAVLARR